MSGFTLKLMLSGLLAFVPHSNGNGLTILIPKPSCEHPHVLTLRVKESVFIDSSLPNELIKSIGGYTYIPLPPGYELSIGGDISEKNLFKYRRCKMMSPKKSKFWRRLCLISLDEYIPDSKIFNMDCLGGSGDESCESLRNRLVLKSGKLKPRKLHVIEGDMANGREVAWMKKGVRGVEEHHWAAEQMVYSLRYTGTSMGLTLTNFHNSLTTEFISLRSDKLGKDLVVELDFSPKPSSFCNCDQGGAPSAALSHLQELSVFYSDGPYKTIYPGELMSYSERAKIRNECVGICNCYRREGAPCDLRPQSRETVVCYSAEIRQ